MYHFLSISAAALLCCTTIPASGVGDKELSGDRIATDNGILTIHPVNHATFLMQWNGKTVYFDPATLEAIVPTGGQPTIIAPRTVAEKIPEALRNRTVVRTLTNGEKTEVLGIAVEAVPAYNTTPGKEKFHPKGRDNGYVLTMGGRGPPGRPAGPAGEQRRHDQP